MSLSGCSIFIFGVFLECQFPCLLYMLFSRASFPSAVVNVLLHILSKEWPVVGPSPATGVSAAQLVLDLLGPGHFSPERGFFLFHGGVSGGKFRFTYTFGTDLGDYSLGRFSWPPPAAWAHSKPWAPLWGAGEAFPSPFRL